MTSKRSVSATKGSIHHQNENSIDFSSTIKAIVSHANEISDNPKFVGRYCMLGDLLSSLLKEKEFDYYLTDKKEIEDEIDVLSDQSVHNIIEKAENLVQDFRNNLSQNSFIDVFHLKDGKWYKAKILTKNDSCLRIRYSGFGSRYDEDLDLQAVDVYPSGYRTSSKFSIFDWSSNVPNLEEGKEESAPIDDDTRICQTHSGRRVKRASGIADNADVKNTAKKKRKSKNDDQNDWICKICDRFEAEDGTDLLLCDGPCKGSFHYGCLAVGSGSLAEIQNSSSWLCGDCKDGFHSCFICGKRDRDCEMVNKCSVATCGKFYHYDCLIDPSSSFVIPKIHCSEEFEEHLSQKTPTKKAKNSRKSATNRLSIEKESNNDSDADKSEKNDSSESKGSLLTRRFTFRCPYHSCDTCSEFYGPSQDKADLYKCLKCPRAFHINCIPPGSRFNSLCLLCPLHPSDPLPSKEPFDIDTGFWSQISLPECLPSQEDLFDTHFRLPLEIKQTSFNQTDFKNIIRLDYDFCNERGIVIPLIKTDEHCSCQEKCKDHCLNRVVKIECNDSNCSLGENCGNRWFQNRQYALTEKFQEFQRGWGLRSLQTIPAGGFVVEYLGEVIDREEALHRMKEQHRENPLDHDYYIMELGSGLFVDGRHRGNCSRYINHSCDPNCELQRWVVKGRMHIGIFAKREIFPGEALSYDYQFDTQETEVFKCYCGTGKCRGTMAPKTKRDFSGIEFFSKLNQSDLSQHHENNEPMDKNSLARRESDGTHLNDNDVVAAVFSIEGDTEDGIIDHQQAESKVKSDEVALDAQVKTEEHNSQSEIRRQRLLASLEISKEDRQELIAQGKALATKWKDEMNDVSQELNRSYVSKYHPGDHIHEIKNGPLKSTFQGGRERRIFLIRNIQKCVNFLQRRRLMWKRVEKKNRTSKKARSAHSIRVISKP